MSTRKNVYLEARATSRTVQLRSACIAILIPFLPLAFPPYFSGRRFLLCTCPLPEDLCANETLSKLPSLLLQPMIVWRYVGDPF
jgi:hypothetical protein